MMQVKKPLPFIARHGVWTDEQRRQADDLKRRVEKDNLHLVRLAWADPHGAARAKAVTVPTFLAALETGYNINVATTTLDSANARTFASFTRGGGMGLDEMTGSPNLTIVPDPATFRVLPWASGIGWVLCDEYFNSGVPFHFSPRQLLRKHLKRLADKGMDLIVGLEIEWYLLRVAQEQLRVGEDGGERVVEVVREAAHGLAERAKIVALLEPAAALRDPSRQIPRPAPERQDRAVDLDLGARHLARDVLDLFVVGKQQRILGGLRLSTPTDPLTQALPDPSHAKVSPKA